MPARSGAGSADFRKNFQLQKNADKRRQKFDQPDDAFMVRVLGQGCMEDVRSLARYRDEFDEAM